MMEEISSAVCENRGKIFQGSKTAGDINQQQPSLSSSLDQLAPSEFHPPRAEVDRVHVGGWGGWLLMPA
jgi:hypothetical protein